MLNTVYLLIIIATSQGVATQSIPQANMKQCEVNARTLNNTVTDQRGQSQAHINAKCVIGVK